MNKSINRNRYCVIMAGGIGSRFWPISRVSKPKQFLDMLGTGKTFLRSTFERFAKLFPVGNFLVVTNTAYRDLVLAELPELSVSQILCEPFGRNTAPCIAYAAFRIRSVDPDAVMVVTPADHLIIDNDNFCTTLEECMEFASDSDALVTIGIKPTRPDTGYGYIQIANKSAEQVNLHKVKTFTEKPNYELACAFVRSGEFFWNAGIFVWRVESILNSIGRFLPETYRMFDSIGAHYGTSTEQQAIDTLYPECRSESIDYGVMERSDNVYVRCSDFGWSDIGTWGSMYQYAVKDDDGNTACPTLSAFDTHNCIVNLPKGKIAVIDHLSDYIVVDCDNVLMICPRSHEQEIKKYIESVKFLPGGEKAI